MRALWQRLARRVDGLALRERVLLLVVVLVVTVLAVDFLWLSPTQQALHAEQARIEQLEGQRVALQARLQDLARREAEDPEAGSRARLQELREEIARLDEQLHERTLQFVSPNRMASVLEDLIVGSEGLTLVSMRSEPARALPLPAREESLPAIYRHGLAMELRGDYLALLGYLRRVEAMPWGLFWEGLEVRADADTPSRFVIRVFTLSMEEDWIGV
ncbi:MSHA biogenesis protein MshJ [Thioalkalivibrio denitrificans]|uniref:MSHA biogenesis protein MshJ n=1 Tax=Thioalkalivibrio denitrificans TaxID=108003 RepID=A0A1V3NNT9_9GAMM|nr:MSHA biogenesis protein MshJ [Thioalkalivibrio denitrificans]OOG26779.1 MSHA biogenesis protein MshJ [Thioalkalivibrio denitrificans]